MSYVCFNCTLPPSLVAEILSTSSSVSHVHFQSISDLWPISGWATRARAVKIEAAT